MINIITDSCCDLGCDLIERFNILTVPLTVVVKDQAYKDGIEITTEDLFASVKKTGELPKTTAVSTQEFIQFFKQTPGDLLYIGISSALSCTVPNAQLAAQEFPERNIRIIDSKNLSTGIGLLVLKAAELREQGHSLNDIADQIENRVPNVHSSFMIDTLDYLYLGGRCTALQSFFGSMLKIRPIIEVKQDGSMGIQSNTRGTRKRGLNAMVADFQTHADHIDLHRVFVTHTDCDEDAQYLTQELKKVAPIKEIQTTRAGATISSHCGPGTIGILYFYQ